VQPQNALNGDDAFWDRMHASFSDTEIGDIVNLAGIWLGVGHGLKALGIGSVCQLSVSEGVYAKLRNAELGVA
jgi:hypothetical protein